MQGTLQITLRGIDASPALEDRIRALADRLERFAQTITSCHVTVQNASHHAPNTRYEVRVRVAVPHGELVATREGSEAAHEPLAAIVRDAFEALSRRLDERSQRRHRFKLIRGQRASA